SAYGDLANIRTAMNRGAFDFLTKPISFQDLTVTLEKAFAHVRSMNERKAFQERARFVKETFGRFLDDRVVQTLLEHPTGADLGGERREISILMSDLRGFTALSER